MDLWLAVADYAVKHALALEATAALVLTVDSLAARAMVSLPRSGRRGRRVAPTDLSQLGLGGLR